MIALRRTAILIVITFFSTQCYSQVIDTSLFSHDYNSFLPKENFHVNSTEAETNVIPIAIGIWSFLYLFNPTIQYEDDRIRSGLTKEFSLGFGYFGEYRLGFEYSFIFKENQKSQFRFSLHYDYLMADIKPSNMLQSTGVISVGSGLFTDFDGQGIGPEVAYGFSIRNHKFLFFPHIKLRHTFMFEKRKADITDFSFGIIIGIANPFIDLKIRRSH